MKSQAEVAEKPEEDKELDEEFIEKMLEIEKKYVVFKKHEKIRVEQWTKKLCQVTSNAIWKKNRNLYAKLLLSQVISRNLQEPFNKGPPEGALPKLNKLEINKKIGKTVAKNSETPEVFAEIPGKIVKSLGNDKAFASSSSRELYTSPLKNAENQENVEVFADFKAEIASLKENCFEKEQELAQMREKQRETEEKLGKYREKCEFMQSSLEKVQEFLEKYEKRMEKFEKFKEVKAGVSQCLQGDFLENAGKSQKTTENHAVEQEFGGFLEDAYSETSKFLEKLEFFKQKTELLRKEIEESCEK